MNLNLVSTYRARWWCRSDLKQSSQPPCEGNRYWYDVHFIEKDMKPQKARITLPKSFSWWVCWARIQTQSPRSFYCNALPSPVALKVQGWMDHGVEPLWFSPSFVASEKACITARTKWRMTGSELWQWTQFIIINELYASSLKRQPSVPQSNWMDRDFPLPVATTVCALIAKLSMFTSAANG